MLSSAGLASLCFANQVRFHLQSGVLFEETNVEISHFAKKYLQLLYGWQDCHSETKTKRTKVFFFKSSNNRKKKKEEKKKGLSLDTGKNDYHNILNSKENLSEPFYLSGLK